jgi:dissimilatory sulfite reductase (desulfoviridin) alpha/beta subunit
MSEFFKFQDEIDDALTQSARDLHRLAEFYRRHGKMEYANQVEESLPKQQFAETPTLQFQSAKKQEKPYSHFHWLHLPAKKVG